MGSEEERFFRGCPSITPSRDQFAVNRKDANAVGIFRDVHGIIAYEKVSGAHEIGPLGEEFAFRVKDLDPMILSINYPHSPSFVNAHRVRNSKLTGITSWFSPRQKQLTIGVEFMDPTIAVTVRHVDFAFR